MEWVDRKVDGVGAEAGYDTLRSLLEDPVLPDFLAEVAACRRRGFPAAVAPVRRGTANGRRPVAERGGGGARRWPACVGPRRRRCGTAGSGAFASVLGCPRDESSEIGRGTGQERAGIRADPFSMGVRGNPGGSDSAARIPGRGGTLLVEWIERETERAGIAPADAAQSVLRLPVLSDFLAEVTACRRRAFPAAVEPVRHGTGNGSATGDGVGNGRRPATGRGAGGARRGPAGDEPCRTRCERPGAGSSRPYWVCERRLFRNRAPRRAGAGRNSRRSVL